MPPPAGRRPPECHLLLMHVGRRVDADLQQAAPVPLDAQRRWPVVFITIEQAEGQSTGRSHRTPSLKLTSDNRAKLNQPVGGATVGNLEIEMNPRAVVPDLLVDVGVSLGRCIAPEFRMPRPRLTERPAQHRGPKGDRKSTRLNSSH